MNNIKNFGRYLDQPVLVKKFAQKVPPILTIGASTLVLYDTFNTKKEKRKKRFLQNSLTMFGAVASALAAPKITQKIFKSAPKIESLKEIEKKNTKFINDFLAKTSVNKEIEKILQKSKSKVLNINEVKILSENLTTTNGKKLLNNLIPEPENISSHEIFSEIGRLSVYGLIPVLGGIVGGIAGDMTVDKNYKEKIPNKIKEGVYQYLANIFLCNVGAGIALGILEQFKIKSKAARALGMVVGIIATGVVGGSFIANYIGKHFVNRCFSNKQNENKRKPEPLDICLHTDDIATVAVMSGLRWIEPTLPALYSISGYRAGIGYRGKHTNKKFKHL